MIEQPPIGAPALRPAADAYLALHLLPTAPPELVDHVYDHLSQELIDRPAQRDELRAAYALLHEQPGTVSQATVANGRKAGPLPERSPLELLHVTSSAPPHVVELAYRFWRDSHGPTTRPGAARASAPSFASADARLAALAQDKLADAPSTSTNGAASTPSDAPARLVAESGALAGTSVEVGKNTLRIGTDPTCDVVVMPANDHQANAEARISRRRGRFILHGIAAPDAAVRVDGADVTWAVLDDGDRLEVAGEVFRFEAPTR